MNRILLFLVSLFIHGAVIHAQDFMYGACFYPEQVSKDRISIDADLMQKAGMNVVRMSDFAWAKIEAHDGDYAFGWLENVVDTLSVHGVKSILCTPTAAVPLWMYNKHLDIMQVTADGIRKPYGKRRHACINNPYYRGKCETLARNLAEAFKDNRNIVGFQIDNELGAEEPYCYCEECRSKFARWLEKKYIHVDSLNNSWNTMFWSEVLETFDDVWLPRKGDNPSAFLDFQRFYSDCIIDFFVLQRDAIRSVIPDAVITHNICSSGFLYQIDLYKFASACDFLSLDNYPYTWTLENEYKNREYYPFSPYMAELALSQIRGSKKTNFWITEAQVGRTAGLQHRILQSGILRLWTHQEYANGAMGKTFFSWRTFRAAHEHTMTGVLDVDGSTNRRYDEVKNISSEIKAVYGKLGTLKPVSKVAIVRDFDCDWALEDGRISGDFRYMRTIYSYYTAFRKKGISVDIISSDDTFDGYQVVVVPSQVVMSEKMVKRLKKASQDGTHFIITCMSGLRDMNMSAFNSIVMKELTDLCGVHIDEQHSLSSKTDTKLIWEDSVFSCGLWHDVMSADTGVSVWARFGNRFFKDYPAVTYRNTGKGGICYVATVPEQSAVDKIAEKMLLYSGLRPAAMFSSSEVSVTEVCSSKTSNRYLYVLNFSDSKQKVIVNGKFKGQENDCIEVAPMDYMLLEFSK